MSKTGIWPMELPPDLTEVSKKSSARAMTWLEILDEIDKLPRTTNAKCEDIAAHQAEHEHQPGAGRIRGARQESHQRKSHIETKLRYLVTELHMRPALALGCLCFVLVGCPVGIWFSRSDYLSAFITCFLPIVVIYYP